MIKLNRTTEYALIALSYLRLKDASEVSSAREIAARFNLPFEILAKTLQKLKDSGLISSNYGTKGGYVLSCELSQISLDHFLSLMEGQTEVVCCISGSRANCEYKAECTIQPAMKRLNQRIQDFLHSISLDDLTGPQQEANASIEPMAKYFSHKNTERHYD